MEVYTDRLKLYLPHVDGSKIVLNFYRPHREVPEDDTMLVEKISSTGSEMANTNDMSVGKGTIIPTTPGNHHQALLDMSNKTGWNTTRSIMYR